MKLFRFELAFNGEPQGVGFLQGIIDISLQKSVEDNLYSLFDRLPSPELDYGGDPVTFWFTEYGLECFGDAINTVIKAITQINWQILGASMEEYDLSHAVYNDKFQVLSFASIHGERTQNTSR